MKKFLLASVLVLMFGALCFTVVPKKDVSYCTVAAAEVVATEEETPLNEETEEANYFREKIMPYITANISSILTALLTIMVTLGKIKAATAELKASNSENAYLKKKNKKLEEDVAYLKEELASVKKTAKNTSKMVKIGFCNTSELVENGFAEEIAKVGENEEESES